MKLNPHLNFNGRCEEALQFYAQCLGGQIVGLFKFAGSPAEAHVPAEWRDKVLHATLNVGGQTVMAADAPPGTFQTPQGFAVTINVTDAAEGERIFRSLADGGKVQMAFARTFWSPGFGMAIDRFGIPWMVNTDQPQPAA